MKQITNLIIMVLISAAVIFGIDALKNKAVYTPAEVTAGPAEGDETATYTIYNTTGKDVVALYVYEAGSEDKGDNFAGDGLKDGDSVVVNKYAPAEEADSKTYVVEFQADGEDVQLFETLHFEVAPICLRSIDGLSGATPIQFAEPTN